MRIILTVMLLAQCTLAFCVSDSLGYSRYSINAGVSISPQMVFLAALDLGAFANVESQPFDNNLSVMAGIELRNRWFTLDVGQNAGTKGLNTHYAMLGTGYMGCGITLLSKTKIERNSFYLTAKPYLYSYKESVSNEYFSNAIMRNHRGVSVGITWSNTRISAKGRRYTTQFYLPLFGEHFLDGMRYMSFRLGVQIK